MGKTIWVDDDTWLAYLLANDRDDEAAREEIQGVIADHAPDPDAGAAGVGDR